MAYSKKIVIITPYLLEVTRGIERYCLNLADAMVRRGIDVTFYTWGQKREHLCGSIHPQIKVRKVPYCRYFRAYWAAFFYRFWLKKDKPDTVLLNFMYHGEEYLPKVGHYLYVLHSPASQIRNRYEYVRQKVKSFSNIQIVAISQFVAQEAVPYFEGKPISLIYNGTDTELFKPAMNKTPHAKLRIITPAAYEERKGIHGMIQALSDFKYRDRIQYDVYGSGSEVYGNYLKELIAKYHLEGIVALKGSATNIPEIEPQYDLFALPSKGEAFALSPIEALACGLPILISTYPPYPEFVKDDFGFMVNPDDVKAIQQVLIRCIEEPQLLAKMSVAARKKSEDFSWNKIVGQYIQLLG